MTMYEVSTEICEISKKYLDKHGHDIASAYVDLDNHNDKVVGIYESTEEAREVLAAQEVYVYDYGKFIQVKLAYIFEGDYDVNEDGELEFNCGGNYVEFKIEEPHEVSNEDSK